MFFYSVITTHKVHCNRKLNTSRNENNNNKDNNDFHMKDKGSFSWNSILKH